MEGSKILRAMALVDEHKEKMQDGAYLAISEGLQELHRAAEATTRTLYDCEWVRVQITYRFHEGTDTIESADQEVTNHRAILRGINGAEWLKLQHTSMERLTQSLQLLDKGMIHVSDADLFFKHKRAHMSSSDFATGLAPFTVVILKLAKYDPAADPPLWVGPTQRPAPQ